MAVALWWTLSGRGPIGDVATYAMAAIGVSAWGIEKLRPMRHRGANVARVAAGAVLGVALGAMLAQHLVEPFAPRVVRVIVLIVALAAGFAGVDLLASRAVRKTRDCDENRRSARTGAP